MSMLHRHAVLAVDVVSGMCRVVESLEQLADDLGVPRLDGRSGNEAGPV